MSSVQEVVGIPQAGVRCGVGDLVMVVWGEHAGRLGVVKMAVVDGIGELKHPSDAPLMEGLDWVVELSSPPEVSFMLGRITVTNHWAYRDSCLMPIRGDGIGEVEAAEERDEVTA